MMDIPRTYYDAPIFGAVNPLAKLEKMKVFDTSALGQSQQRNQLATPIPCSKIVQENLGTQDYTGLTKHALQPQYGTQRGDREGLATVKTPVQRPTGQLILPSQLYPTDN